MPSLTLRGPVASPVTLPDRLLAYSATAGVTLLAAAPAAAAVVHVDLDPDVVRGYNTPYDLDLNGDSLVDATFSISQAKTITTSFRSSFRRVDAIAGTSNSLLLTAAAQPLPSNYLVSSLLAGWAPASQPMAYFTTYRAPGYPVSITSGGPWLGVANRFVGIRFQIGANTHYGWIRMSVAAQAKTFTIADFAYEDLPDTPVTTGVWLPPGGVGALGAAFTIHATEVDPLLANFTRKPKVAGIYFDPLKAGKPKTAAVAIVTKLVAGLPVPTLRCEWKKTIRLYDLTAFKAAYAAGRSAEDFLAANSIANLNTTIRVLTKERLQSYNSDVFHYEVGPPLITDVTDPDDNPVATAGLGDALRLHGQRFGKKPPKVWLEYVVAGKTKMAKLKLVPPLPYADANGKPAASCMDPDSGASRLTVLMPATAWPAGWQHGPHHLVLDNGAGIATVPFATGI